jgi:2-methylaconitate cis-trans-isomerase PrpF
VSDHDFVFAVDLSDPAQFDPMLAEVARAVFVHVGYHAAAASELAAALKGALVKAAAGGGQRCTLRFEARGGELQMAVSCDGGGEWRTSRPLP